MTEWSVLVGVVMCMGVAVSAGAGVLPDVPAKGRYVVVTSDETAKAEGWTDVVSTLRKKHDGDLIVYPSGDVASVLPALRKIHPRYAVFVARPEEAGREFVVAVHRLTRKLDEDPYTDLRWGIVTGYEAADALRIVRRSEPLIINSAASSMGPGSFKSLDHGFASSETDNTRFWLKKAGEETVEEKVSPDPVKRLTDAFNAQSPDMFVTSGHATEKDWQVIYNKHLGSFRCEDGQLYGLNSKKERFDINSPGVKVYLPMGNCLIGHIPGRDCMATAWMHTGGVHQMFGYTGVTFHGYMGWGMGSYFGQNYSLSESFFFNNQALIRELEELFPEKARVEFKTYDRRAIQKLAQKHGIRDRKLMGHLWDRDVVAFYGDPAWVARHRADDPAWKATWRHTGESVEIKVQVLKDGKWGNRPLGIPFPVRLGRIRGIDCSHDLTPVVTDDFALLPVMDRERKAGETIVLRFGAHAVETPTTSADSKPVVAGAGDGDAAPVAAAQGPFDPNDLGLPEEQTIKLMYACKFAEKNVGQIVKAFRTCGKDEVADVAFLVANMPLRDLHELTADYLLDNVRIARKGLETAPWKDDIAPSMYRDYILPYACITEKREAWRKLFAEKVPPLVEDCTRPGEAAVKLNQSIYELFKVKYHATKRPRADQGPLESIEAGYASCTGLSVMLVNACRSVGIPARLAGVCRWSKGRGNHTWVEVWDGEWHCLGASESEALNKVWFGKAAAAADVSDPLKRVYATRFQRGTLHFPVAWNPYADYVPAVDVSEWYKARFGEG